MPRRTPMKKLESVLKLSEDIRVANQLQKLIGQNVLRQLKKGEVPKLVIPKRDLTNIHFDKTRGFLTLGKEKSERYINKISQIRPFFQTTLVGQSIIQALQAHDHPSLRDVFYYCLFTIPGSRKDSFDDQPECNAIIEDIEVITGLLREELGIVADPKGKIVGDIRIRSGKNVIDCSRLGDMACAIPSLVDRLDLIDTRAEFVLVIEKGAIFERLKSTRYWEENNCLLITGKGVPDRGTRRMVRRLRDEFGLPILVLCDADPYGFYIWSVYRAGSMALAYESERLACSKVKFLGVSTSDIYKYKIPRNAIVMATKSDLKRAGELLEYEWFKSKYWQDELNLFLRKKEKVEIEAFNRRGFRFLAETYLPEKIRSVM